MRDKASSVPFALWAAVMAFVVAGVFYAANMGAKAILDKSTTQRALEAVAASAADMTSRSGSASLGDLLRMDAMLRETWDGPARDRLSLRVSSMLSDGSTNDTEAIVGWSYSARGPVLAKGSKTTIPGSLLAEDESLILSEAGFDCIGELSEASCKAYQRFYARPRRTRIIAGPVVTLRQ